jgi:osmotically-inducible protein OsmY
MKKTVVFALILGVAACGDKPKLAAISDAAPQKVVATAAPSVDEAKPDADKALAARVGRAMEQAKLHGIDAVAAGGIVTLWGATLNARERERAAEIARNVEGVEAVENRLEVVSGS